MATLISKLLALYPNHQILDGLSDTTIELMAEDIANGEKHQPNRCAFARAIRHTFPVEAVYFYKTTAWIQTTRHFLRYMLPSDMQRVIRQFDAGRKVQPGVYTLLAPKGSTTIERVRQRSKKRPGRHHPREVPTGINRKPRFANRRLMASLGDDPPAKIVAFTAESDKGSKSAKRTA